MSLCSDTSCTQSLNHQVCREVYDLHLTHFLPHVCIYFNLPIHFSVHHNFETSGLAQERLTLLILVIHSSPGPQSSSSDPGQRAFSRSLRSLKTSTQKRKPQKLHRVSGLGRGEQLALAACRVGADPSGVVLKMWQRRDGCRALISSLLPAWKRSVVHASAGLGPPGREGGCF